MIRRILQASSAIVFSLSAFGQAFDAASIKPDTSGTGHFSIHTGAATLTMTNVTLKDCILLAYHLQDFQISGGPGWLGSQKFDIEAKSPAPVPEAQLLPMLQTLLKDRFALAAHHETKELPMYRLVQIKGATKLHPAESSGGELSGSRGRIAAKGITMEQFAETLSRAVGRRVLNQTSLTGTYDFTLEWLPDELSADPSASGPSLFTALQEQLGLKLESSKGPVEVLVIDGAEKPSEN